MAQMIRVYISSNNLSKQTGEQARFAPLELVMKTVFGVLLVWLAAGLTHAEQMPNWDADPIGPWVEASGRSEIHYGDQAAARVRALRDALENASMQVNARVHSSQVLENGSLTVDRLKINSAAQIQDMVVIDEFAQDGIYFVQIRAQVSESQVCATHIANSFRKSVAVTGFAMEFPGQSTLGHLGAVDRKLASHLVSRLNGLPGITALDANYMMLYQSSHSAPTTLTPNNTLTRAVDAAEHLGVQFVVSGIIRDLAMKNMDAPYGKKSDRWLSKVGLKKEPRDRQFVFDVYVHDGYSGALVFQSRYSAHGIWNAKHHEKTGFATARFWSTQYGEQVYKLVTRAVDDLQQTVQCQPFMANISKVKGNRIYVQSGASSGLRPGDSLSVYRTSEFFDREQNAFKQITDTKIVATVKQVQPHFAIAELPIRVERVNIQQDDLVIAW